MAIFNSYVTNYQRVPSWCSGFGKTSGLEVQLEALEGRIKEEKLRLSEAAEQLKTLEETCPAV